jgi:DNA-binding LytR/AlgR family response regulator
MINVLIVDDEKPARDEMEFLLKEISQIHISGIAGNGDEALEMCGQFNPDLIFLDIKMAEMNGFEVAEQIHNMGFSPGIIFTTAYDSYALKAFEISALDYILKPLEKERVLLSIEKFTSNREKSAGDYQAVKSLMKSLEEKNNKHRFISILHGNFYKPIPLENIICITAHGKETDIHTPEGVFRHSTCIGGMERILQSNTFFRCHRSYIINLKSIKKIEIWFNNTYRIEMTNIKEKITVSRSYIARFREIMAIV